MPERSNDEWLQALQSKGQAADAALADLRSVLLRGLRPALLRNSVTEADLEDFVQDAMIKILAELASFRGEARFTTWALKIAVRTAFTELRRRRWQDVSLQDLLVAHEDSDYTPAMLRDQAPDPGQMAMRTIMVVTVQRLISEELTEKQRRAMMAVMVGGMPLQEAARRMGTNRNALYKLLYDARQRLQRRLQREGLSSAEILAMFAEDSS
jgi:RNA polymerase sigma-70 factor (ECF subfamily)